MNFRGHTALLSFVLLAMGSIAQAGTVNLWGIADGDSIYIEEQSSAFFRMDLYDPPPRETQQRFHDIANPSVTFGSLAFDGFPNDQDFRLGHIDYDESGLAGGTGAAPITALVLGVGFNPDDPSHINYGRWSPTNTFVDSFAGTVDLLAGQVVGINLTSAVHLSITTIGSITVDVPGTFTIDGATFAGHMEVVTVPSPVEQKIIYDFSGTLTTVVPEPSTWLLAGCGGLGLAAVARRRKNRRPRSRA